MTPIWPARPSSCVRANRPIAGEISWRSSSANLPVRAAMPAAAQAPQLMLKAGNPCCWR